jgi:phosphatidylglycerol:prolipoprotein diacylglycerol transferase
VHPILFHIGSFPVRSYSLAILIAFVAAYFLAERLGRRWGLPWTHLYVDFVTWAAIGGILGARIWEVAFQWSYYGQRPMEIFAIWEGGLSIQGGVLGGLAAAWLFTRLHKLSFARFADACVPSLLLGQGIGRLLGCTLNGDAFGRPTGTAFGLVHVEGTPAHATFGDQPLWPAEVFEGIYDLALLGLFLRLGANRGIPGHHFMRYVTLYSAGRFALEFLRADMGPVFAGLTAAQLGSVAGMLLGGAVLAWQMLRRGRPPQQAEG